MSSIDLPLIPNPALSLMDLSLCFTPLPARPHFLNLSAFPQKDNDSGQARLVKLLVTRDGMEPP